MIVTEHDVGPGAHGIVLAADGAASPGTKVPSVLCPQRWLFAAGSGGNEGRTRSGSDSEAQSVQVSDG